MKIMNIKGNIHCAEDKMFKEKKEKERQGNGQGMKIRY